jgi:cystathionine beta-lyase/cystathionine gamma-synthase
MYFETPSNPDLRLFDISALSKAAHDKNPDIQVVVDNTFLTPAFQRCLELGADIVLYSTSKYIAGHADVIGGMLATNSDSLHSKLKKSQYSTL